MTSDFSGFRPWFLDGQDYPLGYVDHVVAARLLSAGCLIEQHGQLYLGTGDPLEVALENIRVDLFAAGLIGAQRGEMMPVRAQPFAAPLAVIDRSAMRILGLWATKVHVNGLVYLQGELRPRIWLSRRSARSASAPLAYDTMIAGGQAAGTSIAETLIKEAAEEVGLPPSLSAMAVHVRDMTASYVSDQGLHREVLSIHDLPLPASFQPLYADGEIVDCVLLPWAQFAAAVNGELEVKHSSREVCRDLIARFETGDGVHGAML